MNDKKTGCFYLVGMGTHPDLITVRGARVVERADILILKQAEELEGWKEWIQEQEIWSRLSSLPYSLPAR
ncbi:MAG TPA: hypothetical protein DD435_02160 [Cyanobacteria bacterium UBA8530]|nr:hypothetical protein [Cyanobacteria bacterium UBA8530]